MNIPGANVLGLATRLVARQAFKYLKFIENSPINSIGYKVPIYADPIRVLGSIQAIPRRLYQQYGLDLQKTYYNFFLPQSIMDIQRDVSSDQFLWNNQKFQCESVTPWYGIDGWVEVLTVQVPS